METTENVTVGGPGTPERPALVTDDPGAELARMKAATEQYEQGFKPKDGEKPTEPAPEGEKPAEPKADAKAEKKPEAKAEDGKAAEKDPQVASRLALIQRREKEQKAQDAARNAKTGQREEAVAAREAKVGNVEAFIAHAEADPIGFILSRVKDPALLKAAAEASWIASLGDAAPPEQRAKLQQRSAMSAQDQRMAKLEAENARLASLYENTKIEQAATAYRSQLQASLEQLPEHLEVVRMYAEDQPAQVAAALYDIQRRHIEANPGAELLPVDELAEALEKSLAPNVAPILKKLKGSNGKPAAPAKTTPAPKGKTEKTETIDEGLTGVTRPKKTLQEMTDEERLQEAARVYMQGSRA
jgi:hypothetical protein